MAAAARPRVAEPAPARAARAARARRSRCGPPTRTSRSSPGEPARDYVLRVAREKARAVDGRRSCSPPTPPSCSRGEVLGKPARRRGRAPHARARSPARAHEVLTGVCVRRDAGGAAVELDAVVVDRGALRAARRGRDRLVRRAPASRSTRPAPTRSRAPGGAFVLGGGGQRLERRRAPARRDGRAAPRAPASRCPGSRGA